MKNILICSLFFIISISNQVWADSGLALLEAVDNNNIKRVNDAFKSNPKLDINYVSLIGQGETSLHIAVEKADPRIIELLVEKGADLNAKDELRQTPLHYLANRDANSSEIVKIAELLVKNGASLTRVDAQGDTLLHKLAKNGRLKSINALMAEVGADPTITNENNKTCFDILQKAHPDLYRKEISEKYLQTVFSTSQETKRVKIRSVMRAAAQKASVTKVFTR